MQNIKELLEKSLNIDFLGATLSNPKEKGGIQKVKVRPILKKDTLLFQCEEHKNNQVFHNNYEADQAAIVLSEYMEQFKQMQMETKQYRYTILVSKKGKVTIQIIRLVSVFFYFQVLVVLIIPLIFVHLLMNYYVNCVAVLSQMLFKMGDVITLVGSLCFSLIWMCIVMISYKLINKKEEIIFNKKHR